MMTSDHIHVSERSHHVISDGYDHLPLSALFMLCFIKMSFSVHV